MICDLWRNERIQIFQNWLKDPWWVLYQKKDHSEKVEKQSTGWRNFLTEKKKKTLQFCHCFSYGWITLLAERLHEFKFPGASTIRSNTVVGQEPSKENFFTASIMWPGSSSATRSSSIRSRFFSPLCHSVYGFVIYMLMGTKIFDLYTFIKPSYSRVFKLANVCNDGFCHCSVYDLLNYIFKISFFLWTPASQRVKRFPADLAVPGSNSYLS